MALFENNVFEGQRIQLDGHRFVRNHFVNCVLVYGGGPLQLVENEFRGVSWEFVDAAARTVHLLSSFYQQGGDAKQLVERLLATFGRAASPPTGAMATPVPEVPTSFAGSST